MSYARAILRGMGYVEGYGPHPGTPIIVGLLILGWMAGTWMGALAMLAIFGPVYVYGAWSRGLARLNEMDKEEA